MQLTNHLRICPSIVSVMPCILLLVCTGCANGDDPETVALIKKHLSPKVSKTKRDENGLDRIYSLGININAKNRTEMLELLSRLGKLEHLEILAIGGDRFKEDDLKLLPPLPNLRKFSLGQHPITDKSLKYISSMTGLKELRLGQTQIVGPGLAHLKGFDQLKWLDLGSTPLDDSAMPHVAENFPKLKRFDFGNTKVTPEGLMKLVDLHWLETIGTPDDITGQSFDSVYSSTTDKQERNHLIQKRRQALQDLRLRFDKAHLASNRKARAAGVEVPPDSAPFGSRELVDELEREMVLRRRGKQKVR